MATFARSARWTTSSSESANDKAVFKRPQMGGNRRHAVLQPNRVPTAPKDQFCTRSSLNRRNDLCNPLTRSQFSTSLNATKKPQPASEPTVPDLEFGILSMRVSAEDPESFSSCLLPKGVADIDSEDSHDPQLVSQYAKDIFNYLAWLEEKLPMKKRYLRCQPFINSDMRAILVNWLMLVHGHLELLSETLFLTVSIIDRYLQAEKVERSKLQLVGVAALFLAAKYEEMYSPSLAEIVHLTGNAYSKREVLQMERSIVTTIQWGLGRPISLHFLRRASMAGQVSKEEHCMSKYALELSLLSYELSWVRPSELAAAALCLSINLLGDRPWDPTLTHYSRYSESQLAATVIHMATLMLRADTGRHTAPFKKFKESCLGEVSLLAIANAPKLQKIAGIN